LFDARDQARHLVRGEIAAIVGRHRRALGIQPA
jgi:hypothetical protein